MQRARTVSLTFVAALAVTATAFGQPLPQRIDALISAGTPDYGKRASPAAADAEFLRRVTLDLTGTIPAPADVRLFLDDKSAEKRAKLIDKLLAGPDYARNMAYRFDT